MPGRGPPKSGLGGTGGKGRSSAFNNGRGRGGKGSKGGGKGGKGSYGIKSGKGNIISKGSKGGGGKGSPGKSSASSSSISNDFARYLKQLNRPPERLEVLIKGSEELWLRCWVEAPRSFDMRGLEVLATALAKVPFSAVIPPPPLRAWKEAMQSYLKKAEKSKSDSADGKGPPEILAAVNVVMNASRKLLEFEWEDPAEVKAVLEAVLGLASDSLKTRFKDHRDTRKNVDALLDELEKPWIIKHRKNDSTVTFVSTSGGMGTGVDSGGGIADHTMWRTPTVDWLRQPQLFTAALLPKMQVPSSKSRGVYESKGHYHDTLERLMIGMTFSDGHAALMPRCFEAMAGRTGSCGNTLLPVDSQKTGGDPGAGGGQVRCRSKKCGGSVVLACPMRSHCSGLCARCADREKQNLLGKAGPHASTHVYDGFVRRVDDVEGKLFVEDLKSRQPPPPQRPIHWHSTKRLQAPNLVGVVQLGVGHKGRAIKPTDLILWAEIANHPCGPKGKGKGKGKGMSEGSFREQGRVCLNMLSVTGSFDPDRLAEGSQVAIVDCMTFVPEYVPVVRALEQSSTITVPFDDGAYLNLWSSRPTNISNTVGQYIAPVGDASEQLLSLRGSVDELVEGMILNSMLQPIREIRQSEALSAQLKRKLVQLIEETTLDEGQLVNFIDALRNPVHLTQGPPGTGKSYLGVVLIRALYMIRQMWSQQNPSIGHRPVLVLSYKNHATDEICADYISTLPPQSKYGNSSVIRLGKSQDPRLFPYLESTSRRNNADVSVQRQALEKLRDAVMACSNLSKAAHLFTSFYADMFQFQDGDMQHSEDTETQQQRQRERSAYDATEVLLACIVRAKLLANNDADEDEWAAAKIMLIDDDAEDGKCRKTQSKLKPEEKFAELTRLHEGFRHYMDYNSTFCDPAEMIFQWLKGLQPLPMCACAECGELALSHGELPLCNEHRCNLPLGVDGGKRCSNPIGVRGYLCDSHVCLASHQDEPCELPRIGINVETGETRERFCENHACFKCKKDSDLPSAEASDDPPRNTCTRHPLCFYPECLELQTQGYDYCAEHSVVPCLLCGQPSISRDIPYCAEDVEAFFSAKSSQLTAQTSQPNFADEPGPTLAAAVLRNNEAKRCAGKNKKHKQCGSRAVMGSDFCHAHATPESSFAQHFQDETRVAAAKTVMTADAKELSTAELTIASAAGGTSKDRLTAALVEGGDTGSQQSLSGPAEECDLNVDQEEVFQPEHLFADAADVPNYDNLDEVEETEGAQHLREILGEADDDEDDYAGVEFFDAGNVEAEKGGDKEIPLGASAGSGASGDADHFTAGTMFFGASGAVSDPKDWTWEMTLQERWQACEDFMLQHKRQLNAIMRQLKKQFPVERKKLQSATIRANARAYENKTVIFGTIVGCIGRLEAIRAVNPFAILVEEASEVLEPLLYACIGPSTVKFQMIGDHQQLSPSNMQKFDFERANKINVSMFERLIRAPEGHAVPNGVLSIQRRMRRDVCDLTRLYYKDTVKIEDHAVTGTRKLPGEAAARSFWKGREIPGVESHVFLWTHVGPQTKAEKGLSKVNKHEANLATSLAYYLVACGVERRSIAILTPYKGQLMLMRKMLLADKSKKRLLTFDSAEKDQVRLSTVDRFQGDEGDVVIVSLVVDDKSRTPFVKLVNRMIVLLSRARLGMYVLGNVGYFESSKGRQASNDIKHWIQTFDILKKPAATSDNGTVTGEADALFIGERVGPKLPLCCPQHPLLSRMTVDQPRDLALGFCKRPCEVSLPCSHSCGMRCHWPQQQHERKCKAKAESPCPHHPGELACHFVFDHNDGSINKEKDTIGGALEAYRCPESVTETLPCGHEEKLKCFERTGIVELGGPWPKCSRPSPVPFVHPACQHERSVTCEEFERFKQDHTTAPKCQELVVWCPSTCDHTKQVKCHQEQAYRNGVAAYKCMQRLAVQLPRCGHEHTVGCTKALELEKWEGSRCDEQDVVREGVPYGPKDFACRENVTFKRECGHETVVPCDEAFLMAEKGPPLCMEQVSVASPYCGHLCKIPCHQLKSLREVPLRATAPIGIVHEGSIPPLPVGLPRAMAACKVKVTLHRKCKHTCSMECGAASRILRKCEETATLQSPLCAHEVPVACHLRDKAKRWSPWSAEMFEQLQSREFLPDGAKPQAFAPTDKDFLVCMEGCRKHITVEKNCGHTARVKCGELMRIITNGRTGRIVAKEECGEKVEKALPCGHLRELACKKWQQISEGIVKLPCKEKKEMPCWNAPTCGCVAICVPCTTPETAAVCCERKTTWQCPAGEHTFPLALCSEGTLVTCPKCSEATLDAARLKAQSHATSADDVTTPLPHEVESTCFSKFGDEAVQALEVMGKAVVRLKVASKVKRDVWSARLAQLLKLIKASEAKSVLKRQLFCPGAVPIFFEIADPSKELPSGFSPLNSFAKAATYGGIQVHRLTVENLRGLAAKTKDGDGKMLLLGFTCTVNAGENVTWPRNKKQKQASAAKWRGRDRFDCVEFEPQGGMARLVIFEPFPIYATHRCGPLSKEDLNQLATVLSELPSAAAVAQQGMAPQFPARHAPAGGDSLVFGKEVPASSGPSTGARAGMSTEGGPAVAKIIEELCGSLAEEFKFPAEWDGEALELPGLSEKQDTELLQKLSFANPHAPPFAGIRFIENIEKMCGAGTKAEDSLVCNLQLLKALELLSKDAEGAKDQLDAYCASQRKLGMVSPAHPLALLAFSRINAAAAEDGEKFIRAFVARYPAAADLFLSEVELKWRAAEEGGDDEDDLLTGPPEDPLQMWLELKAENDARSNAMDKLLKLTGLRKIKLSAVRLFKTGLAFARMGREMREKNAPTLNYCFMGNPGTGKTTVARLFAEILRDSGLREKNVFEQATAQKLKEDGTDEFRKKVANAKDGVLFIDEAYDLDPIGDKFKGVPIVNELMNTAEDERERLTIILAGYEDDMNDKFFAYNPGLKSRFTELAFDDFDEAELFQVWSSQCKERGWMEADPRLGKVVVKRLVKASKRRGFGNARAVRQKLDEAVQRAFARPDFDSTNLVFKTEDVVGENPANSEKLRAVLEDINAKVGWAKVKKEVGEMVKVCTTNYERELDGQPPLDVFLNRMFLGNPGTGKTTCARLYGRVLKHLGFLSNGDVIEKTASDLGGQVVGQAQQKTAALLDKSIGKVLIIDEAYALNKGQYGSQALDTIVERVQNGGDIAVILLGYEDEMLAMLRDQNPGLKRRFDPDQAFYFEDYTAQELVKILQGNCEAINLKPTVEFQEKAIKKLEMQRRSESNFGNAGAVDNLVKAAVQKAMARGAAKDLRGGQIRLEAVDVDLGPQDTDSDKEDPFGVLDKLYRMDHVKKKLQQLRNVYAMAETEGEEPPPLGHFVFTGAPGTGKTTVARATADILYRLGLIGRNNVVETSGLNLTGEYVGQTKKKVEEQLDEAKGGVLFIDEAYELGKGQYGSEACSALVAAMTDPQYAGLAIIVAGYKADMDRMLDTNPGLKSRFTHSLEFPDWAPGDCVDLFQKHAERGQYAVEAGALAALETGFAELIGRDGWGNARDVDDVWKAALRERADRAEGQPSKIERKIIEADVRAAIGEKVKGRTSRAGRSFLQPVARGSTAAPLLSLGQPSPSPSPLQQERKAKAPSAETEAEAKAEAKDEVELVVVKDSTEAFLGQYGDHGGSLGSSGDGAAEAVRDEGVSDEAWIELEQAKAEAAAEVQWHEAEMERLEKRRKLAEEEHAAEIERTRLIVEQQEREEGLRRAREAYEAELRALKEAEIRRQEEMQQKQAIQEKLRQISPCPAGFQWYKHGEGWRCAGGSHFVSNNELNKSFMF